MKSRPTVLGAFVGAALMAIAPNAGAQSDALATVSTEGRRVSITEFNARGDGSTINTKAIQSAIDQTAANGGGTVVIPKGEFVSGAIDLKSGVNLHLEEGSVLRATTKMEHFPSRPTRTEGLFVEYTPALINAEKCDGLRISGTGTLDGDGRRIWDEFWRRRLAAPDPKNFPNRSIPRARLAFIANSRGVTIDGPTFKDSQFWNLHLYNCRDVTVRSSHFRVPDDYKQAPSTDGIDLDSCQDVLIEACEFSVTDDCVAMKGTRGPRALEDRLSRPVERIVVRDCVFRRGHAAVTLGSDACTVRDVLVEDCRVTGAMSVACFKLRADTPQTYENVRYNRIHLDSSGGYLVSIRPWGQYIDLEGMPPPRSVVKDVSFSEITGRFGAFGTIAPNPGQTSINGIEFRDIKLKLRDSKARIKGAKAVSFSKVVINGNEWR